MNKSIRKVPEIRFKGFSEDWKQRKAKEICTISTGKGNTQDKVEYGKYPFYVRSATIERSNDFLYDQEAVLTVGDGVGTGKVFHYVNGKYNLHQRVYRMYGFNSTVSARYFYYYFSKNFYRRVMAMTAKTSVDSVRMEMIADMDIIFPNEQEQEKIVDLFDDLANTITLHKRKIALLKQLKQGYLQDMFPQKEESVPKIRFANLDSVWVQHKLGEVIDSQYNGQTPSRLNDEFWDGDINWLSSGELNRAVVFKTIEKITEDGKNNANLKVVPKGTFVMAITGLEAAGTRGNCAKLGIDTTLNQSCMALFPNKKVLNDAFLFQWYRKVGEKYGIRYTQGTKQQSYNAKLLEILPIILPNIKEQTLISNFLDKLDETIALHQAKLEKLQSLKKAYLQKMFI